MNQPQTQTLRATPGAGMVAQIRARVRALPAWPWVAALTVLALVLRNYHLGAESFWFDEADIIAQAQQPLGALLYSFTQAGESGPLYTLLLHYWIALFGTGEVAVRTLPLIFGTATVPVLYYVGKRLVSRELGLLAAGLLAVSPFHIWHSQDAKMYTMAVLGTLASTALYVQSLETGRARWWAAYIAVTWIALATHGLAILILIAQLLATPVLWPRLAGVRGWGLGVGRRTADDRRQMTDDPSFNPQSLIPKPQPLTPGVSRRRRRWAIAMLVLTIPFLPTAWERLYAWLVGNLHGEWYAPTGLGDMLGVLFVKFANNQADPPWEAIGAWVAGALFALGLWPWVRGARRSWAFLGMMWLAPIVVFWLITLHVPLFEPRYLIIVLPFYLLFVGAGLLRLARIALPLSAAALLLLLSLQGVALAQINYSPVPQKEEWRQAIDYVKQHVRLRDVIIVDPGYLTTAVQLYYQGGCDLPQVPIEAVPKLTTAGFGTRELAAWLDQATTDHERVWLITSPARTPKDDPQGAVQAWFEGQIWPYPRRYQFDVQEYIGVKVYGYALNGQPHSWYPGPVYQQAVAFAGGFRFLGSIYEVRGCGSDYPHDQTTNAGWLPLTLYWRFDQPPTADQDYIISVHLLDAQNKEWARYDLPPLKGYRPTTTFDGEQVIDYADMFIPGNAPPGTYHITFQVWPRCTAGQCWDAAHPQDHAGTPLAVVEAQRGATPGATSVTLSQPLQILAWQPPK